MNFKFCRIHMHSSSKQTDPHSLEKVGFCLFIEAWMAFTRSLLCSIAPFQVATYSRESFTYASSKQHMPHRLDTQHTEWSLEYSRFRLVPATATGLLDAMREASSRPAAYSSSLLAQIRDTNPQLKASLEPTCTRLK